PAPEGTNFNEPSPAKAAEKQSFAPPVDLTPKTEPTKDYPANVAQSANTPEPVVKVKCFYRGSEFAVAAKTLVAALGQKGFDPADPRDLGPNGFTPDTIEVRYFRYPEETTKAEEVLQVVQQVLPGMSARISYVEAKPGEHSDWEFEVWF